MSSSTSTSASLGAAVEQKPMVRFFVLDQHGKVQDRKELLPVEGATFGQLLDPVVSRNPELAKHVQNGGKFNVQGRATENDPFFDLDPKHEVAATFPEAVRTGTPFHLMLTLSPLFPQPQQPPPPLNARPATPPAPVVAPVPAAVALVATVSPAGKSLLEGAAKNIKALGRLKLEVLMDHLHRTVLAEMLQLLDLLEVPPSFGTGGGGGGGSKPSFTIWYEKVKTDVQDMLKMYQGPLDLAVELNAMVDRTQTFAEYAQLHQQGGDPMELMKGWIQSAQEAASTNQRLSMLHYIALGHRLEMAHNQWLELKHSGQASALNLHTKEDFLAFLNMKYTVDYCRKLVQVAKMAEVFPNLGLISCCGIGELIQHKTDFLKLLVASPSDATFWRCDPSGSMGWQRRTSLVAYKGSPQKRQKIIDLTEDAPNESFQHWQTRSQTTVQSLIAEDEAAGKKEAEVAKSQAEEVEKLMSETGGL